jgi:hypothetical protein
MSKTQSTEDQIVRRFATRRLVREMVADGARIATRPASQGRDYRLWQALCRIADEAPEILEMVRSGEDLEPWQEHRLELAAEYIDSVHDSLTCRLDASPDPVEMEVEEVRTAGALDNADDTWPSESDDVHTRAVLVALDSLLATNEIDAQGRDLLLRRMLDRSRRDLGASKVQQARVLAGRMLNILGRIESTGPVKARAVAAVALNDIASSSQPWAQQLEKPITWLATYLWRQLGPEDRRDAALLRAKIMRVAQTRAE